MTQLEVIESLLASKTLKGIFQNAKILYKLKERLLFIYQEHLGWNPKPLHFIFENYGSLSFSIYEEKPKLEWDKDESFGEWKTDIHNNKYYYVYESKNSFALILQTKNGKEEFIKTFTYIKQAKEAAQQHYEDNN